VALDTDVDETEIRRVAVLRELDLLDKPRSDEFEALARLAAYICGTPTAAVNLIDRNRQWQAGAHGKTADEVPRSESMCTTSILTTEVTYTPDASRHETFRDHPYVTGERGAVRLYVAAPLVVSDHVIGTLCAFAPQPAELEQEQIDRLRDLAFAASRFLELRGATAALAHAAVRDPLTGLHNRAAFRDALDAAFARRARTQTRLGVVFIDLDGFKPVNDTFGHAAGDAVLREVAARLLGCVRATDLVVRLGGDEFVILVEESPDATPQAGMVKVLGHVKKALLPPFTFGDGGRVSVTASVGWAVDEGVDDTPDGLLHRADVAMYHEKGRPHLVS
jgi:diguanylate cyclase (GGDEF)-like protein